MFQIEFTRKKQQQERLIYFNYFPPFCCVFREHHLTRVHEMEHYPCRLFGSWSTAFGQQDQAGNYLTICFANIIYHTNYDTTV